MVRHYNTCVELKASSLVITFPAAAVNYCDHELFTAPGIGSHLYRKLPHSIDAPAPNETFFKITSGQIHHINIICTSQLKSELSPFKVDIDDH